MLSRSDEMAETANRPLKVVRNGDITIVICGSALRNANQLEGVSRQLLEIAEAAVPPWMIVDLAATEYFGASFIEVLLRVWKRIRARDGAKLAVGGLQQYCREVLEITQVDRMIPLFTTREEAVAALPAPAC